MAASGRDVMIKSNLSGKVLSEDYALEHAQSWINAWNKHDLDEILSHYSEDTVLTSPVAFKVLNLADGTIHGKDELRKYFERALKLYPDLHFEFYKVFAGVNSIVMHYKRHIAQNDTLSCEMCILNEEGKIIRTYAHYAAM